MRGSARAAMGAMALGLTLAVPAWARAPSTDPAQRALVARDAFVSVRALGAAAPEAEKRLAETATRLAGEEKVVKLAIVAGPAGAPSMMAYARRLRRQLAFGGTLAVTAPGRAVVAIGPRPSSAITADLRAARVGRIADPVERVIQAAERAVQAPRDDGSGSSTRGLTALLALAVIGGAWAAAWGLRREMRRAAAALAAERARVRVELDALRAQLRILTGRSEESPAARTAIDRAMGAYSTALVQLERSRRPDDVWRALPDLEAGLAALREAADALGTPIADDALFDGLCTIDPGHGPATTRVVPRDGEGALPACDRCADNAAAGRPPMRRMVPLDGRDVPFDEAPRAREIMRQPDRDQPVPGT